MEKSEGIGIKRLEVRKHESMWWARQRKWERNQVIHFIFKQSYRDYTSKVFKLNLFIET